MQLANAEEELADMKRKFDEFVENNESKLPPRINMHSASGDDSVVEAVADKAVDCDQDQEQEGDNDAACESNFNPASSVESALYHELITDDYSAAKNVSKFNFDAKFASLLDRFYGSTNFFLIQDGQQTRPKNVMKTAYQYLVACKDNKFQVVLMDTQDAKADNLQMNDEQGVAQDDAKDYYLMSSAGQVIAQNAKQEFPLQEWENHPELTILTKIFSRSPNLSFNEKEINYLARLDDDRQQLYFDFFEKEILSCWQNLTKTFQNLKNRVMEEKSQLKARRTHSQLAKEEDSTKNASLYSPELRAEKRGLKI